MQMKIRSVMRQLRRGAIWRRAQRGACLGLVWLGALFGLLPAQAFSIEPTTFYWDSDAANNNNNLLSGAGLGGSGNWNHSLSASPLSNWWPGIGGDQAWDNNGIVDGTPDLAVFWGSSGTVSLIDAISIGGLAFRTTGYTLSNALNTLTFAGSANTITLNSVALATISGRLAGTGSVTISGGVYGGQVASTLLLNGTDALNGASIGGWSGATTINNGMTVSLAGNNRSLASTSGIALNGGNILLTNTTAAEGALTRVAAVGIQSNSGTITYTNTNTGAAAYNQSLGTVALTTGRLNVTLTTALTTSTQTLNLGAGSLTHVAANTSSVVFSGAGSAANLILVATEPTSAANQIIGPWATFGTIAAPQTDYASYNRTNGTANSLGVQAAAIAASAEGTWTTSTSANTMSADQTLTAARTMVALRRTGGTLALSNNFNLQTFGVLNGATGAWTISGTGAVTTPTTAGGPLFVTAGRGAITISAPVNNNGAGVVSLVVSGSSLLTLSSTTSTYSGGTIINGGPSPTLGASTNAVLAIADNRNLGATTGGITFDGSAALQFTAAITVGSARTISLNNGAIAKLTMAAFDAELAGKITGTGGLILESTSGNRTFTLSNGGNDFQGPLAVGYTSNVITAVVASIADSATANGAIRLGATTSGQGVFQWAPANGANLVLSFRQIDLWGATGGGALDNSSVGAATITVNTDLSVTGIGNKTLTLQGTNTGANTFAGKIGDGAGSVISVNKVGSGNWTLSGADTFTGLLTGTQGTLTITGSILSASAVSPRGGTIVLSANSGLFGASVPLSFGLNGGTFIYDGTGSSGAKSNTISALQFAFGEGVVQSTLGTAASTALSFTSLTRSPGAAGNFIINGGVNGLSNTITITGQGAGFIGAGLYFQGSRFAWMDGAGTFVRGIDYTNDVGAFTTGSIASITPGGGAVHIQTTGAVTAQADGTFGSLNIAAASDFTLAPGATVNLGGILKSGGGASLISGGAGISGGTELIVRTDLGTDALTISSMLLNATRVTKSGAGALTLNAPMPYVGFTNFDVTSGALNVNYGSVVGTASTTITLGNNATFTVDLVGNLTHTGVISGNGNLAKAGDGVLILNAVNTYIGTTTIRGGILSVSLPANLGNVSNDIFIDNNATLQLTASTIGTVDNTSVTRELTVGSGGAQFDFQVDQPMDGAGLHGTGPITKLGNGVWSVTSNLSSFSGALLINDGTLRMTGNTLANATSLTVTDGATLNFDDDANGAWVLANQGVFTLAGKGEGNIGAVYQTLQAATVTPYTSTFVNDVVLTTSGTRFNTSVDIGTVAFLGTISGAGGIEKRGVGTLVLSGNYTFASGVELVEGNLTLTSAGTGATNSSLGTGTLVISPGTPAPTLSVGATALSLDFSLTTNNPLTLNADLNFTGTSSLNLGTGAVSLGTAAGLSRTITVAPPLLQLGGAIANGTTATALTKAGLGRLVLYGNSTYSGTTTISSGVLQIGNGGAAGSIASSSDIVNNASLIVNRGSGSTTLPSISGSGTYTQRGAGTAVFAGTNTYVGTTTIEQGTLVLDYVASGDLSKLLDTGVLSLGNAVLQLSGGAHLEVVGSTTLTGRATITRSDGSSILLMNTVTPGNGSVHFTAAGIAQINNSNTNGILGSWATILDAQGKTTWAMNASGSPGGSVIPYNGSYADVDRLGSGSNPSILTSAGVSHVRIVNGGSSGPITLGAATTQITTLSMTATDGSSTIDLGTGTLNIGSETGGGILLSVGAGALTIGNALNQGTLTTGATANTTPVSLDFNLFDVANILTVNSVIANNGTSNIDVVSLNKLGLGTLVLNGTNLYTGTTTLGAGVLKVTVAGGLGAGTGSATLRLAGGTLQLSNASDTVFGRNTTVVGNAAIVIDSTSPGTGVAHTLGTLAIGAQTLTVSATATSGISALTFGAVTATGSSTFVVNSNGSPASTVLTLPAVSISAGSTLTFDGSGDVNVTGIISGASTGGITKYGSGTLKPSNAGNTYAGLISIFGGTFAVSNSASLGTGANDVFIDNGAKLQLLTGATLGTVSNTLSARQITVGSGGAIFDFQADQSFAGGLSGTGTVTKTGVGVWSVGTSSNPFTGKLIISGGELRMASAQFSNATGMSVLPGGTFTINDDAVGTWSLRPGSIYSFSGTGATANFGALRQTQQSGTNAFISTIANPVLFATPGTVVNTNTPTGTISITGVASGAGGFEKLGTGTLSLSGANTYASATTVTAGKLVITATGSVTSTITVAAAGTLTGSGQVANVTVNGGILAPGDLGAGKLTSVGTSNTWSNGTKIYFEFRDPTGTNLQAGTNWDLLDMSSSTLALSGTITLRIDAWKLDNSAHATLAADNAFDNTATYSWLFARTAGVSGFDTTTFAFDTSTAGAGVFGTQNAFTLQPGRGFWVSQSGNDLYINYAAVPEPSSLLLVGVAGFCAWRGRKRALRKPRAAQILESTIS
ncbi:MAG: hypothetical protein C0483_21650 [Pirellula sp.]|nr:hypothetical protein [Pirellula sp.]